MYKFLIPVFILITVITINSSCNKNLESTCPTVSTTVPDSEKVALTHYIDSVHAPNVVMDVRGFYYSIADTGIGKQPNACNVVTVNYSGRLTDSTIFDSNHNSQFTLNQLIKGWQVGIPLIKKGGIITLYLPPSLAYGSVATATIPANSILIFRIELVGVQ